MQPRPIVRRHGRPDTQPDGGGAADVHERKCSGSLDPKFLPQQVAYGGSEKPGTIVIDSARSSSTW